MVLQRYSGFEHPSCIMGQLTGSFRLEFISYRADITIVAFEVVCDAVQLYIVPGDIPFKGYFDFVCSRHLMGAFKLLP